MNRPYANYSDEDLELDMYECRMRLFNLIIDRDFDVAQFEKYGKKIVELEKEFEYRTSLIH